MDVFMKKLWTKSLEFGRKILPLVSDIFHINIQLISVKENGGKGREKKFNVPK